MNHIRNDAEPTRSPLQSNKPRTHRSGKTATRASPFLGVCDRSGVTRFPLIRPLVGIVVTEKGRSGDSSRKACNLRNCFTEYKEKRHLIETGVNCFGSSFVVLYALSGEASRNPVNTLVRIKDDIHVRYEQERGSNRSPNSYPTATQ